MKKFNTFKSIALMVTIIFGMSFTSLAQDIIVFNDGSLEQAKILEINENDIKYKKWDKQDGPTYTASKSRVLSINYQDGSKDSFVDQQQNNYNNRQNNNYYQRPQRQPRVKNQPLYDIKGGFSVHFGLALPIGDFGSFGEFIKDNHALMGGNKGSADVGFNIGLKWLRPFQQVYGLGLIVMADFNNNKIMNFSEHDGDYSYSIDYEYSSKSAYINIPLFVGLNYSHYLNQKWSLYGEFASGLDIRKITDFEIKTIYKEDGYETANEKEAMDYKTKVSFAFQLGAGIKLNDRYSLGLHYYGLGSSKIEGDYTYTDSEGYSESGSATFKNLSTTMFMVRLGFHF